jgi:hypothetical protein
VLFFFLFDGAFVFRKACWQDCSPIANGAKEVLKFMHMAELMRSYLLPVSVFDVICQSQSCLSAAFDLSINVSAELISVPNGGGWVQYADKGVWVAAVVVRGQSCRCFCCSFTVTVLHGHDCCMWGAAHALGVCLEDCENGLVSGFVARNGRKENLQNRCFVNFG